MQAPCWGQGVQRLTLTGWDVSGSLGHFLGASSGWRGASVGAGHGRNGELDDLYKLVSTTLELLRLTRPGFAWNLAS